MRSFHKLSVLAVVTALGGVVATPGCSSSKTTDPSGGVQNTGRVGIELSLGGGVTVNSVHYVLTGPGGFNQAADVDITAATTISFPINNVPAGNGYSITLSATASDGSTAQGTATFDVTGGHTTIVNIHLQFHQAHNKGTVIVNGSVNECPFIDSLAATPDSIVVGGTTAAVATVHDSDGGPSPISYQWSSTSGTFSNATAAAPTFTATLPGTATLQLVVSDGDCTDTWSVDVAVAAGGGGGAGGAGAGGAGAGGASAGGASAGGASAGGASAGGASAGGASAGGAGAGGASSGPTTAEAVILQQKGAACLTFIQNNCPDSLNSPDPTVGIDSLTGNATAGPSSGQPNKTLALTLLQCVLPPSGTASCATNSSAVCYCGSAAGLTCANAGAANGTCQHQEENALESTDPSVIIPGYGNQAVPGGLVNNLLSCLSDAVASDSTGAVCYN